MASATASGPASKPIAALTPSADRPRKSGGLFRLRLRTILLLINLVVLILPLGSIFVLRIYESALIRQTESELIAQGAVIAAAYQTDYARLAGHHEPHAPGDVAALDYGNPLLWHPPQNAGNSPWRPRSAQLDLADDLVRVAAPEALIADSAADPLAQSLGHELTPVLRGAQLYTLAGIRVVDYQGIVVATTGEDLGASLVVATMMPLKSTTRMPARV